MLPRETNCYHFTSLGVDYGFENCEVGQRSVDRYRTSDPVASHHRIIVTRLRSGADRIVAVFVERIVKHRHPESSIGNGNTNISSSTAQEEHVVPDDRVATHTRAINALGGNIVAIEETVSNNTPKGRSKINPLLEIVKPAVGNLALSTHRS